MLYFEFKLQGMKCEMKGLGGAEVEKLLNR